MCLEAFRTISTLWQRLVGMPLETIVPEPSAADDSPAVQSFARRQSPVVLQAEPSDTSIRRVLSNSVVQTPASDLKRSSSISNTLPKSPSNLVIASAASSSTSELPQSELASPEQAELCRAVVVRQHKARGPDELSLRVGTIVIVSGTMGDEWYGSANGESGWFPERYVEMHLCHYYASVCDSLGLTTTRTYVRRCVELMYEPRAAKQLDSNGYKIFNDLPSSKDWHLLLMGAVRRKYRKNEVILHQGDELQRIYQIIHGECTVQVATPTGEHKTLAFLGDDETFGEISFLLGGGAKASVVAHTDTVSLFVIEADYFKRLFNADPRLAGRFFKYLCTVLERRVREPTSE